MSSPTYSLSGEQECTIGEGGAEAKEQLVAEEGFLIGTPAEFADWAPRPLPLRPGSTASEEADGLAQHPTTTEQVAADMVDSASRASKQPGRPSDSPTSAVDFWWHLHSVIDSCGGVLPMNQLMKAYWEHAGHELAAESFFMVGEGGIAATLQREPRLVAASYKPIERQVLLRRVFRPSMSKELLLAADRQYRRLLRQQRAATRSQAQVWP